MKEEMEQKKEYLKLYLDAVKTEKVIEEEIHQLRLNKMCPSAILDGMPHSTTKRDLSDYAAQVDELLGELKESMNKRILIRRDITRKIEEMESETEKLLLRLKYIHGKTLEEISLEMQYSWRHTSRIHSEAINHFKLS